MTVHDFKVGMMIYLQEAVSDVIRVRYAKGCDIHCEALYTTFICTTEVKTRPWDTKFGKSTIKLYIYVN